MRVRLKLPNKERFYQKLRKTVPQVEAALDATNAKSATEMVGLAKRLAPIEDGDLQNSIRMSRGNRPTSYIVEAGGPLTTKPVTAGADAEYDYALGQEFGTQKMPANPFFFPAYRVVRRTHKGRVTRAINKTLKQAGF